jgi:protein phosphatase-4 regulatory subunit 3
VTAFNEDEISPTANIVKHRDFLQNKVKFKKLLESLNDESIIEKIHLNYRLTYLKDTAMARFFEDQSIQVINNLLVNNN